ncbi:MAG: metallopeptidase family protein, partial [Verrucomicrobiales bacterium]|nr:metallopeptidase family protein [Verrucomicrobiales bacterium]
HPTDELMGLFEGCPLGQTLSEDPADWPRITLFLGAIWDEVMGDARAYREEVRVTLLHELGHYLGLDEDQVAALGLA